MQTNRIIALTRYFFANEKRQFWPPFILYTIGVFLIGLLHAECSLPHTGIIAFFALWGFIQTVSLTQSIEQDFTDGTFAHLMSEGYSVHGFALARLLATFIHFSVPLLISQILGLLIMGISLSALLGLVINHIHYVVGLLGVQLTLCLASSFEKKLTNLMIFIPFWIPSFLYLVGNHVDQPSILSLLGLALLSIGMTVLLIHNAFKWRC